MTPELRCGRLTARAESAIAIFRVCGPRAAEVLAEIFRPNGAAPLAAGQVRVGRILDGPRVLDDAVVRIREAPDGWEAEISVHGGLWVGERLEALLRDAGGRPLEEPERWPAAPQPDDAVLAEAREGLLASFADAQVFFFLDAIEGSLSRALESIERSIAAAPSEAAAIADRLEALLRRAPLGLAMTQPPSVIFAGVPNAGKSTLFNALVGESRAIVSAEPGTTRDVVEERVSIAGLPARMLDSAGIRRSADAVERLGVARAEEARGAADIVVVLIDPTADPEEQCRLAEAVGPRSRRIVALSKADRPEAAALLASPRLAPLGVLPVSALSGTGIAALRELIVARSPFGAAASVSQAAPFRPRHVAALSECLDLLRGSSLTRAGAVLAGLRSGRGAVTP
jgi:tRNA modification GTPase